MSQSQIGQSQAELRPRPSGRSTDAERDVEPTQLLSLLGDEYAMNILRAIGEGAATAQELTEALDGSRSTVYRRLDRLEDAGLVQASLAYDPDGHHKQRYEVAVDNFQLHIDDGSFELRGFA